MKKFLTETNKYKLVSAIRYLGDGFFYPFFSLYLSSRNLVESRIGILLALSPLFAVLLNPVYSKICKNSHIQKIILGITTIVEGISILLISFVSNFYLISAIAFIMAVFGSCHYALMDSLIAIHCDKEKINFSSIRVYGSGVYVLATAFGGYVVKLLSYEITFGISMAFLVASGFVYFSLKDIDAPEKKEEKSYLAKPTYKSLLKNGQYVIFLFIYAILFGSFYSVDKFLPNYLETRGVDSNGYGLIYSLAVAWEVVCLLVLNKLGRKIPFSLLLVISSTAILLRLLPCYFNLPIWVIFAATFLRGIWLSCILHVFTPIVIDVLGEGRATLGLMLCNMCYSLAVFVFNIFNGWIIEVTSYKTFYLINILIAAFILVLTLIGHALYNRVPKAKLLYRNKNID